MGREPVAQEYKPSPSGETGERFVFIVANERIIEMSFEVNRLKELQ